MATPDTTATRRAKARLTNMSINEVSVVDRAANETRFVLVKRDAMGNVQKMTLKLPTEAKQQIMDGLAKALDTITALATMVSDAEEDDTATIPAELASALSATGEQLTALASQYAAPPPAAPTEGAAPPAPDAEKATPGAPLPGQPAAPVLPGGTPDPLAKGLPTPLADGSNWAPQRDDNFATLLRKAVAVAHIEIAELEKAGRKIKGDRYKKLTELHGTLGSLLNELAFDEATAGAAPAAPSPAKKSLDAALQGAGAAGLAIVNQRLAAIEKSMTAGTAPPPAPNGQGPAEPTAVKKNEQEIIWSHDIGDSLKRKNKPNGAPPRVGR